MNQNDCLWGSYGLYRRENLLILTTTGVKTVDEIKSNNIAKLIEIINFSAAVILYEWLKPCRCPNTLNASGLDYQVIASFRGDGYLTVTSRHKREEIQCFLFHPNAVPTLRDQLKIKISISDMSDSKESNSTYSEKEGVTIEGFPHVGSLWLNNRQNKVYKVYGVVSPCSENDDWEVLYRNEEWPKGTFRRRSLEEWFGINKNGDQRFTLISV